MSEASDTQKREARLQRRRQRERQHRAEETAEQKEIRLLRRRERDRARRQQQRAKASDRARSQQQGAEALRSSSQLLQERLQQDALTVSSRQEQVNSDRSVCNKMPFVSNKEGHLQVGPF